MKLYNTLTKSKDTFIPLDPQHVKMYVCGPTVYDRAHIGNARPAVVFDCLYRLLKYKYPQVTYARNITDVDDKINTKAYETHRSIAEVTEETLHQYHEDIGALNVALPTYEPRATDHIQQMQEMIETLISQNHAYEVAGHVVFDVSSVKDYGRLSHRNRDELRAGARVEIAPYKRNPEDFVLWKPSDAQTPGWPSPWGFGRPGWHIECSAMSAHYLGPTFDIHGGGQDLIFPHHENEMAQSQGCFGPSSFVRYWLHNGILTVDGEKMSKSLGNFTTIHDVRQKYHGEVIRLSLLSGHYRQTLDWSEEKLQQAKKALDRWYEALKVGEGAEQTDCPQDFLNTLEDDLNTPNAIAYIHNLSSEVLKAGPTTPYHGQLKACLTMLGLCSLSPDDWFHWHPKGPEVPPEEIERLISQRQKARETQDFTQADAIRDQLLDRNIELLDTPTGTQWRRKNV